MDPLSVAVAAALAILGAEVVKKLLMDKIFPPTDFNKVDRRTLNSVGEILNNFKEVEDKVTKLHEMHDNKDQDGVPLWFVPRSWQQTQQETLNATKEIAFAQKETARALEGVTRVTERLADRITDLRTR